VNRALAAGRLRADQDFRRHDGTDDQAGQFSRMELLQLAPEGRLPEGPKVDVGVQEVHGDSLRGSAGREAIHEAAAPNQPGQTPIHLRFERGEILGERQGAVDGLGLRVGAV
jgi:hypothetical protein